MNEALKELSDHIAAAMGAHILSSEIRHGELMLRVQRDEPGAFAELVAAYWARVFGKFVRQVSDRQEAEDLAQDVFLRLYRSRKRYRPTAKLATWVFFGTPCGAGGASG